MPENKVFLDIAYAIVLSAVTDQYHEKAKMMAGQIENSGRLRIVSFQNT